MAALHALAGFAPFVSGRGALGVERLPGSVSLNNETTQVVGILARNEDAEDRAGCAGGAGGIHYLLF